LSSTIEEKNVEDDNELGGLLSFSSIEEKQPRTTRSQDLGLSLSFVIEEKKLRDGNELLGLSLFFATQEKPTLRFFFWVAEDDDKLGDSSSSFGFFCFFSLELQKMTMRHEAHHCLV
jgi:hypothetical protein